MRGAGYLAAGLFSSFTHRIADEPLKVRFAFYVGIGSFVAAVIAAVWTVVLRIGFEIEAERRRRVRRNWTNVLLEALDGETPPLPKLRRWDRRTVITRFNYLFETLTGDAHAQLRRVAHEAGLDDDVLRMLSSRNAADQLTAIVAAGHLAWPDASPILHRMIADPRPSHSLAAAEARTRIEPASAVRAIVDEYARRRDWHPSRVINVLDDARASIGDALAAALRAATEAQQIRIVDLITALRDPAGTSAVREMFASERFATRVVDPGLLCAMLRAIAAAQDPRDAETARLYAGHPDRHVRGEAVAAIGSLGGEEDLDIVAVKMGDESSWVRYEAARALVRLPGLTRERIDEVLASLDNDLARNAFARAIEDIEVGA